MQLSPDLSLDDYIEASQQAPDDERLASHRSAYMGEIRQFATSFGVGHEGLEPPTPCASWTREPSVDVR